MHLNTQSKHQLGDLDLVHRADQLGVLVVLVQGSRPPRQEK